MKKASKIVLSILALVVLIVGGLVVYVKTALPNVGDPENITVDLTPERIERGRYLANSVCVCMDCHSTRDWNLYSGPLVEGTLGKGGEEFNKKFGFPGNFYAPNITPSALKSWTDGELLRAISSGVNKNGRPLFPVMPHPSYGKMDKEDLLCIIAYLRTLQPIDNKVPASQADFPMNIILNVIPQKASYSQKPDTANQLAHGAYVFNAASCTDCHTPQVKGKPIEGLTLAGGFEFPLATGGIVRSMNITPDKETGIGNWTEQMFVQRFKAYDDSTYTPTQISNGSYNTIMPWMMYAAMSTSDLKAMYRYLQTIEPVNHKVERFTPPSQQ